MIKQKKGKIINIGSIEGLPGYDGENDTAYATAKAAVHRFTEALALEWAPFNINVNAIAPGAYPSQMWYHPEWHLTREEADASLKKIQFGNLRELGLLATFLASDASDFMTGQVIVCDSGILNRAKARVAQQSDRGHQY